MVIVQTPDLERDRRRMQGLGVRIVWEIALPDIATIHLHPRDVGGAILSFDEARPPESWRWAGPDWRAAVRTDVCSAIVGVAIEAKDPSAMARRWSEVLDRPAEAGNAIPLDAGSLRFVPGGGERGEGLAELDLSAGDGERALAEARSRGLETDGNAVRLCGVRIRLR
jgi:hypothetical protein